MAKYWPSTGYPKLLTTGGRSQANEAAANRPSRQRPSPPPERSLRHEVRRSGSHPIDNSPDFSGDAVNRVATNTYRRNFYAGMTTASGLLLRTASDRRSEKTRGEAKAICDQRVRFALTVLLRGLQIAVSWPTLLTGATRTARRSIIDQSASGAERAGEPAVDVLRNSRARNSSQMIAQRDSAET